MKVKIDRDRDGWYYFANNLKSDRFANYNKAKRAAVSHGHEIDNAGWRHRMSAWNFNNHALDGYPGWEIENPDANKYERHPAFVKLTHKRGRGGVESHDLASKWDDIAETDFYLRDWTDDGIPFVREGETYWSGWWFATKDERDRFTKWHESR